MFSFGSAMFEVVKAKNTQQLKYGSEINLAGFAVSRHFHNLVEDLNMEVELKTEGLTVDTLEEEEEPLHQKYNMYLQYLAVHQCYVETLWFE